MSGERKISKKEIILGSRRCSDYERSIFGCFPEELTEELLRWRNPGRVDKENHHFFWKDEAFRPEEISLAEKLMKEEGFSYLLLRCGKRLRKKLKEERGLDESEVRVYAAEPSRFRYPSETLPGLEVKDLQQEDIRADLLDTSDVPAVFREEARANMEAVIRAAEAHPEYHWYCVYLNGRRVGSAYALEYRGFVETDDLFVLPAFRGRGIGTFLLSHIRRQFDGILYLHAEADNPAVRLYEKLGFKEADHFYQYHKALR